MAEPVFNLKLPSCELHAFILSAIMTHLYIPAILDAAELMTRLGIQGCLDDSSSDGDIAVTSKGFLFHKGSLLLLNRILL